MDAEIEAHQMVEGSAEALQQLIRILMDNAVGYAQQGGRIMVQLAAKNRKARLCVRNTTHALPEAPPDVLFERFYRADAARSSQGGYGIGLSAARLIALMHRGKIQAHYENGCEVVIAVELPKVRIPRA